MSTTLLIAAAVTMVPGPEYEANWLSRMLLGAQWRQVWTAQVTAPVLDLKTFDGGLALVRRGGGLQTKNVRLQSNNGRVWVFRSIDKDSKRMLDPETADSAVGDLVQDLTSTAHPFAALVVAPLLEAADVIHATPQLVVMPEASQLGAFADFAGVLGFIEERIEHNLPDSDKHVGTYELFERLESRTDERVDTHAYLRARLIDILVGDWDRHVKQWRWARFRENGERIWRPAPRDRDQPFSRFEGVVPSLAEYYTKQLATFGDDYPAIDKLTFSGRFTDRRFFVSLSRGEWEDVTRGLQKKLTDEIIANAVRALPPAAYAKSGAELERALRKRRDDLLASSRAFYALLAREPDVRAPEGADPIRVQCRADGSTEVSIAAGGRTLSRRAFIPAETREIRLYASSVDLRGAASDCISLRVVREPPPPALANRNQPGEVQRYEPPRDWGSDLLFYPEFSFDPTRGLVAGARANLTRFGFGMDPFASEHQLSAAYSTGTNRPRLEYRGDFRTRLGVSGIVELEYSGMDFVNFYGAGNESVRDPSLASTDYYRARRDRLVAHSWLEAPLAGPLHARAGAIVEHLTAAPIGGVLTADTYGAGATTVSSGELGISLDTRKGSLTAVRGFALAASLRHAPAILGNESAFTKLRGEASMATGAHLLTDTFLDLRVAGEKNWGRYPYFESAFAGGVGVFNPLRGYDLNRFAGDAAVVANAEARVVLGKGSYILPLRYGVVALGDVGRVFVVGESSSRWHYGAGGGLWLAMLASGKGFEIASSINATVVRSDERTGVYVSSGFGF
jgi:hypothetical protein